MVPGNVGDRDLLRHDQGLGDRGTLCVGDDHLLLWKSSRLHRNDELRPMPHGSDGKRATKVNYVTYLLNISAYNLFVPDFEGGCHEGF